MPDVSHIIQAAGQILNTFDFTLEGDVDSWSLSINGEIVHEDRYAEIELLAEQLALPQVLDYQRAIEAYVDSVAQARNYTNGISLAGYINSTITQWASEAADFIAWRDEVWLYAYTELDKVQNGLRPQPTVAEFLAELPVAPW